MTTATKTSHSRALLVVDMQTGVLADAYRRTEVTDTVASLVERARTSGVPVVWVRHSDDEGLVTGSLKWRIVPELRPVEGEPVVEKRYGDAFADTDLTQRLAEVGADEILLCGAQTDMCIRSTFYGGLYRGYPVTLVSEAHTTEDMRQWGASFTPEQSIAVLNLHAEDTALPNVSGSVVTAAQAFGDKD